jgi:putative transposase
VGQLVQHAASLGADAITGKPYKPHTQGKNERFHQTLFRYLDRQSPANTLGELQAQVDAFDHIYNDAFDHIYNTERPTKGSPAAPHPGSRGRPPRRPIHLAPSLTRPSWSKPPRSNIGPRRRQRNCPPTPPSES